MSTPKKTSKSCRPKDSKGQEFTTATQAASGIAGRLMQQPTPACDCTRCGMDYCDCSEEQQGTVSASKTEYFRS
jgi:hypothetical protein